MELLAQLSQEAIAGYCLVAITVFGGVVVINKKLTAIEKDIKSMQRDLDLVSRGETIHFQAAVERVRILEGAVRAIKKVIFYCEKCREAALHFPSESAVIFSDDVVEGGGSEHKPSN